jgi:sugar-specific transcriptional regulator TrmB
MKQNLLEQAGLNKNEANVYQIVLEHGEIAPPRVAEISGLSRQNGYAVLKSLTQKELIEELDKRKKLVYRPLPPQSLLEYTEKRKKTAELAEKALQSALPELTSLFNLSTNRPGITYFEGVNGIKKIYEDTLKEKPEEILVFRSALDLEKLGPFIEGYTKRRARLNIKTRIISPMQGSAEVKALDASLLKTRKYIPESLFKLNTEIDIYRDQVAFIAFDKKVMGFVVSSKDIAQTLTVLFELIWKAKY